MALFHSRHTVKVGVDVFILHIASLANLYAAASWTLVNLLNHPSYLEMVMSVYAHGKRTPSIDFFTIELEFAALQGCTSFHCTYCTHRRYVTNNTIGAMRQFFFVFLRCGMNFLIRKPALRVTPKAATKRKIAFAISRA